jgi:hypothetical protein
MYKRKYIFDLQSIILGICIIVAALIGFFYTNGGKNFEVVNMYGDTVKMYGVGIYAYNSIFNVSNYLGANVVVLIIGVLLIFLTLWRNKPLWAEILRTSEIVYLVYSSACWLFGTSMNQLYFLYVVCFSLSLFTSFMAVKDLFNIIEVPLELKQKSLKGTGSFLIIAGVITALVWISSILPVIISGEYSSLLGIQTNEITYGIDLSITCPLSTICGIWIFQKRDIGYKVALLLLNLLVNVAVMVILQRAYCMKFGIQIPIQALVGFIISFVVLGVISLCLFVKLILKLKQTK